MSDITKCEAGACDLRLTCRRYLAPDGPWQSYMAPEFRESVTGEHYCINYLSQYDLCVGVSDYMKGADHERKTTSPPLHGGGPGGHRHPESETATRAVPRVLTGERPEVPVQVRVQGDPSRRPAQSRDVHPLAQRVIQRHYWTCPHCGAMSPIEITVGGDLCE